ncbi:MAG TPA: hypothetical protein VFM03_08115 [Candidatus Limnocylindria bacterium]|jgi:hypothetical protein|nr:hypothetical protein [Candidatus Limnocylindria bacterium]
MKILARLLPLASVALALAACAAGGGASQPSSATPSDPPSTAPSASPSADGHDHTGGPPAPTGIPDDPWHALLADLEERIGSPVTDVTVVSAEAKTWNDGSLGCPVPGQMYTQALVDGYQVVVEVNGERYDYRIGSGTDVRLCENAPEGTKGG